MKKVFWTLLWLLPATLGMSGCSGLLSRGGGSGDHVAQLKTSPSNPAAIGTLDISRDNQNKNTRLVLDVAHLADPKKLNPDASTYVVWAQPKDATVPYNLGALRVDENLQGHLEATTAFHDFQIFVTAEPAANVSMPTSQHVMEGNVNMAAE